MLASNEDTLTLDDVLDELAGLPRVPDARELRSWTARFPWFSKEIVEFVTDWEALESSRAGYPTLAEIDCLVTDTMACVQTALDAEEVAWKSDNLASISGECHDTVSVEPVTGATGSLPSPAEATSTDHRARHETRAPATSRRRTVDHKVTTAEMHLRPGRLVSLMGKIIQLLGEVRTGPSVRPLSRRAIQMVRSAYLCSERGIKHGLMTHLSRLLIFASVLMLAALVSLGRFHFSSPKSKDTAETYCAPFGKHVSARLPDDSQVELNSGTCIIADMSANARAIRLDAGEGIFQVAHDPKRPFVVKTGPIAIEVLGTQFDVYRSNASTRVAVMEGEVQVSRAPTSRELVTALQQIDVPDDTSQPVILRHMSSQEIDRIKAWEQGAIVFYGETLDEIFKEFERYSHFHLVWTDPDITKLRFSGAFDSTNVAGFVESLRYECIRGEYNKAEERITLSRKVPCLQQP